MKSYNKPEMECVCFKIEEKLASTCTGSCEDDVLYSDGTVRFVSLTYSS
jgi:hypothetical protein